MAGCFLIVCEMSALCRKKYVGGLDWMMGDFGGYGVTTIPCPMALLFNDEFIFIFGAFFVWTVCHPRQ